MDYSIKNANQIFEPVTLTEKLAYTTVSIKTDTQQGTGFFFRRKISDAKYLPLLITNKHVIDGSTSGSLSLHMNDNGKPSGKIVDIEIPNFDKIWIGHTDKDVDLCALPMANITNLERFFLMYIDESFIPTEEQLKELSYVEDILMVGYPRGIEDDVNHYPIFRKGITATHPGIDFKGIKEFMIDIACFPGSSGSPVFICNENSYTDKRGNTIMGNTRFLFLGVLHSGPTISPQGQISITEIPTKFDLSSNLKYMMNLGFVIKSSRIIELANIILT